MTEKAILAIEEALLASLFTQRALIELLIKKGIIKREDLEKEVLKTETHGVGAGKSDKRLYLEKRSGRERRQKGRRVKQNRRRGPERRKIR